MTPYEFIVISGSFSGGVCSIMAVCVLVKIKKSVKQSTAWRITFTPDTCSRIQVSRTSNWIRIQVDTLSPWRQFCRWYKIDGDMIRATCIWCKRGFMEVRMVGNSTSTRGRRKLKMLEDMKTTVYEVLKRTTENRSAYFERKHEKESAKNLLYGRQLKMKKNQWTNQKDI